MLLVSCMISHWTAKIVSFPKHSMLSFLITKKCFMSTNGTLYARGYLIVS